jgi:uncharacterized SAM-binding protein YcdF (DUF218 family)
MPILIDKLLTAFILPLGISLILGVAAAALLWAGRQRLAGLVLALSLILLWVFSTPLMAQILLASLENRYTTLDKNAKADVAILLGGMLEEPEKRGGEPGVSGAADRALHAARLYRAGRVRNILISAGNLQWQQTRAPEAEQIAYLLKEWGVPRDALIIEDQSRNTVENAARSKPVWDAHGFRSGLLVTSAFHMPRALAVFRRAGVDVEPSPADFGGRPLLEGGILSFMPDAAALQTSSLMVREWIGMLVYRIRGWT